MAWREYDEYQIIAARYRDARVNVAAKKIPPPPNKNRRDINVSSSWRTIPRRRMIRRPAKYLTTRILSRSPSRKRSHSSKFYSPAGAGGWYDSAILAAIISRSQAIWISARRKTDPSRTKLHRSRATRRPREGADSFPLSSLLHPNISALIRLRKSLRRRKGTNLSLSLCVWNRWHRRVARSEQNAWKCAK